MQEPVKRSSSWFARTAVGLMGVGAVVLAAGVVQAAPPTVTFSGSGCGFLSTHSTPDVDSLTIPDGGVFRVVSQVNGRTVPHTNGIPVRDPSSGEDLVLNKGDYIDIPVQGVGTIELTLRPIGCLSLIPNNGVTEVNVVPAEESAPTTEAPDVSPSTPGSESPEAAEEEQPEPASSTSDVEVEESESPAAVESSSPASEVSESASADASSPASEEQENADNSSVIAIDPIDPTNHSENSNSSGLLALIAAACLVAVGAAAVRTIAVQRPWSSRNVTA